MEPVLAPLTDRTDYPLYVVTADADGEKSGCLAAFVTQCSVRPPRILVCVSKADHTFRVAEHAPGLALHLLGEFQQDLASLFRETSTGGTDTVDRFAQCEWRTGVTGAPVLAECAAWVEGSVLTMVGVGDHEEFVIAPKAGGPGHHTGRLMLREAQDQMAGHQVMV